MIDRDNAVQSGKTARTALSSVLVTAPAALRDQLRHIPAERRARTCAALTCPAGADRLTRVTYQALIRLAQRAVALTEVADDLEAQIAVIVEDLAPGLVAAEYGLGALTAAQVLLSWSHAGRIRTEAAFAMLSGTAPVPASSGRTDRHRLNRLGDRQLNRALHTIAVSRMRSHPPARAYAERRRAEGKTDREIRRCIKRYLARHLYRTLNSSPNPPDDLTNIGASDRLTDLPCFSSWAATSPSGRGVLGCRKIEHGQEPGFAAGAVVGGRRQQT
jgi:transposase